MAANRKNELEDLMKQIQNMPDNDEEDFDEEAEKKNIKMRLAQEEKELGQMEKQVKSLAGQVGVQFEDMDEGDIVGQGIGQRSVVGNKQQLPQKQAQQQNKKNHSEDLMNMIQNMKDVDNNEDFDEAQHRKNMAMYKEDEKDFENVNKMMKGLQGQLGIKLVDDDGEGQVNKGNQQVSQKQAASSSQEESIIKTDEQFSSLKDMVCITTFAYEYKNTEKYVSTKKYPKLFEHFTTKRQKIVDNINKFKTWISTGQLKSDDYITKNLEGALANQERLKKSATGNIAATIEQRIKYIKLEIGKLRLDPNYIQTILKNAFNIIGVAAQQKAPQAPSMTATQILAASQDQLSIPEKIKLISKYHKQNHNLALFYRANVPEMAQALQTFYIPTLQESNELIKQLQNGQNVSISSFIETKLLEITPEVFQKCDVQKFEANRSFYIDKLDLAIKSEFDLQKMIANQKKVAKVNQINDQSNLRIKQYEIAKSALQKLSFNQYLLFPQITTKEIKLDFSLDNKEIDKNVIVIMLKRLVDCKADKYKISYSFTPEQQCLSHQTDWCNQSLVFNSTQKFTLQQGKYPQDLHKKKIDIILFQKGFFSDSEYARGSISLADLETNNTIDSALILDHKGKHFQLEYGVYIRAPISSVGSKSIVVYEFKQYPAFNVNEGVDDFIKKNLANIQQKEEVNQKPAVEQVQKQQPKEEIQHQKTQQQAQQQQQAPQNIVQPQEQQQQPAQQQPQQEEEEEFKGENLISDKFVYRDANSDDLKKIQAFDKIPAGLTVNDLLDLENPSKYRCISYLACGEDMINNGIKAGEYTAVQRRNINKIKTKFQEEKEILKIHCESGKISGEDYVDIQQKLIDNDNKLIWAYTQIGLPDWVEFVKARKQMIVNDLRDNCEIQYEGKPFP
ncbi:hypothetical protein TTHERM_01021920 (macronuclear) [Tetrahymena thermophila SB210]|uniref:Uncharacterized protein n=1 Tax=Tetrahymena thermophila (strain SB210) TaxID=312017 RepID=Q22VE0_TETTS|nr:hypothetical protein TTHERM_01021920 [Tetrahymena thermophila SB210]EAR89225.1 hypothetical protein TTHERM_01021920 [Tetrahymena thermophila SB210]|eukprot:XP_001009470.1 hypothetical protein TTHERM_01021920 [Tetrahymena thermophila SB210]